MKILLTKNNIVIGGKVERLSNNKYTSLYGVGTIVDVMIVGEHHVAIIQWPFWASTDSYVLDLQSYIIYTEKESRKLKLKKITNEI